MSITFKVSGRLGNNLFQYFAAKVMGRLLHKQYEYIKSSDAIIINDGNFLDFYTNPPNDIVKDVYLSGYFQTDEWLIPERTFIQSLFVESNQDRVNENYTIADMVKAVKSFDLALQHPTDLVVHLRLGDFLHQTHNSQIPEPYAFKQALEKTVAGHQYERVIFVVDKLRYYWETRYVNILLTIPHSILQHNDLMTDFAWLYYAPNLWLSRSTLCWAAGLLSPVNKDTYFPLFDGSSVAQVHDTTTQMEITYMTEMFFD